MSAGTQEKQGQKTFELNPLQVAGARELARIRKQIAELKKSDEEMTELFKTLCEGHGAAVDPRTGEVLLTFTGRDGQRRTDYDKLKANHPGVYAECVSQGPAAVVMHVTR